MAIKIENLEVVGWDAALRGMRNPMNSWDGSDSCFIRDPDYGCGGICPCEFIGDKCGCCYVGDNDHDLMMRLSKAGPVHAKFRRMITVYADITAPLYWWKEFDTYKVGTVANSCSTMHKIAAKEFTLEDFSCEHLENSWLAHLKETIKLLNAARDAYHWCNTDAKKEWWWQMIQLLPSSYNQKRTIMLNYEVLANIYEYRKDHKLDEWQKLCKWIETLPYSEIIIGGD